MNIEKYNQRILAIIGTTIIVALVVFALFGIGLLIIQMIDTASGPDTRLKVENISEKDTTQIVRSQNITFEQPIQLDTSHAIFIIPVDQVNLDREELIKKTDRTVLNLSSGGYSYESYYGLHNNFILINNEKGITKQIFDKKVAISEWVYINIKGTAAILFSAADFDSNKDYVLDSDDFQKLYVFYIDDNLLVKYDFSGQTVLRFEPMNKTNMVSILTGIDKNEDNKFKHNDEQTNIYSLNIIERKTEEMVSDAIKQRLQKIIDN